MIDDREYQELQAKEKELWQSLRAHDKARALLANELGSAQRAVIEAGNYVPKLDLEWLEQHGFRRNDEDADFLKMPNLPDDAPPYVSICIERAPQHPTKYQCFVRRIVTDSETEELLYYGHAYADPQNLHSSGSTPEEAIRELNRVREAMHERIDWIYNQAMAVVNDGYVRGE
jgi:hypothetical protein